MNEHIYKSKIGVGLVLAMAAVIGSVAVLLAVQEIWMGLIPLLLVSAYMVHLFQNTYYVIEGGNLRIRCGLFIDRRIDISSITRVVPSRLMMSAPAVSLDRLEISYNRFDSVLVSPKDKEDFLQQLSQINPKIEVIR